MKRSSFSSRSTEGEGCFEKVLEGPPREARRSWEECHPKLKAHEQIEDACLYGLCRGRAGEGFPTRRWRENHDREVKKV